jgi:hypothetical protein
MAERHLLITDETEMVNPLNGTPYVYYNPTIKKVWIFLGIRWCMENGYWENEKHWANDGVFHLFSI